MTIWVQIDRDAAHLSSASSASRFQVFGQTPQFTRRVPTPAGRPGCGVDRALGGLGEDGDLIQAYRNLVRC